MTSPPKAHPGRARTAAGVLVALVLAVTAAVALGVSDGTGPHGPRWARLPDPGASLSGGGALGSAGGQGNGSIHLTARPGAGVALHVVCQGNGRVSVSADGGTLGSVTCADGQAVSYVITDPNAPSSQNYVVQATRATRWRIAVTASTG